jgi:hypothetical protein
MQTEKLTETYTLRISPTLKEMLDALNTEQKHDLNHRLRIEIARAIHNSKFSPDVYLSEEKA